MDDTNVTAQPQTVWLAESDLAYDTGEVVGVASSLQGAKIAVGVHHRRLEPDDNLTWSEHHHPDGGHWWEATSPRMRTHAHVYRVSETPLLP